MKPLDPAHENDPRVNKAKAVAFILNVLRSPLSLMSPSREEAMTLAKMHDISVLDLIETAYAKARNM